MAGWGEKPLVRKRWRTEDRHDETSGSGDAGSRGTKPMSVRSALGAAVGMTALAVGMLVSSGLPTHLDVRRHVDAGYSRSPADDIGGDAVAYTSSLMPTRVAEDITRRWRPGRGVADADGVYLRYDEDSVVILRRQNGSLILIEKTTTAYPRYLDHVAGHWDR